MFRGQYNYQIDAKGRLSVPSRFREVLTANFDERLIITSFDKCLWAYPAAEWQRLERKVGELPQFAEEVKALQRIFISAAVECPIDGQGRILIPPILRTYAGFAKDVVVVGMTRRIEIWAEDRWEEAFRNAKVRLDSMGARLAELGL